MALLIVNAASEDSLAAPGNRLVNYIVVSVTDSAGNPMTGLDASNFKIQPIIVGAGGALVNIESVAVPPYEPPGFYIVRVVPINTQTWKAGTYIFAIAVTRGVDKGQNLASVLMD
jgi:hypothetical protein